MQNSINRVYEMMSLVRWSDDAVLAAIKVVESNRKERISKAITAYSGHPGDRDSEYNRTYKIVGEYEDVMQEISLALLQHEPPLEDSTILEIADVAIDEYVKSGRGPQPKLRLATDMESYQLDGDKVFDDSQSQHPFDKEKSVYTDLEMTSQSEMVVHRIEVALANAGNQWLKNNKDSLIGLVDETIDNLRRRHKLGRSKSNPEILKLRFREHNQQKIADRIGCSQQNVSEVFNRHFPTVVETLNDSPVTISLKRKRTKALSHYVDELNQLKRLPDWSYQSRHCRKRCSVSIPFDGIRSKHPYRYWQHDDTYDLTTYPKPQDRLSYNLHNYLKRRALNRELHQPSTKKVDRARFIHQISRELSAPDKPIPSYLRRHIGISWLRDYHNMAGFFRQSAYYNRTKELILKYGDDIDSLLRKAFGLSVTSGRDGKEYTILEPVMELIAALEETHTGFFKVPVPKAKRKDFAWCYVSRERERKKRKLINIERFQIFRPDFNQIKFVELAGSDWPESKPLALPATPEKFCQWIQDTIDQAVEREYGKPISRDAVEAALDSQKYRAKKAERDRRKAYWLERAKATWKAQREYMDLTGQPRQEYGKNGLSRGHWDISPGFFASMTPFPEPSKKNLPTPNDINQDKSPTSKK